jgi:hypothetical protein
MGGFIDPFGAPEILVEGVAYREMVGSDLLRSVFFANERGERIIRLKLLIPVMICTREHRELHSFVAKQSMGQKLAS